MRYHRAYRVKIVFFGNDSVSLSVCGLSMCVCLSICLYLYVCLPVCLPYCLFVCPSISLSLCLSVRLPICLFVCLPVSDSVLVSYPQVHLNGRCNLNIYSDQAFCRTTPNGSNKETLRRGRTPSVSRLWEIQVRTGDLHATKLLENDKKNVLLGY